MIEFKKSFDVTFWDNEEMTRAKGINVGDDVKEGGFGELISFDDGRVAKKAVGFFSHSEMIIVQIGKLGKLGLG